jgi:AraC-like DNA-binding protein
MNTMPSPDLHSVVCVNDPQVVLAQWPAAVAGLPLSVMPIPERAELPSMERPVASIFVAHAGHGRRWYRRAGRTHALHTAPHMIEIYERGLRFDRCHWEGSLGRCVGIDFPDDEVERLTGGAMRSLDLATQHEVFDARVSRLALELGNEAVTGKPGGALRAQGLVVSLLERLACSWTRQARESGSGRSLSASQQHRLHDLLMARIGDALTLADMALTVGLSPFHFLRVFKLTYGTTPHRYLQCLRVERAAEALRQRHSASITDIALSHGFASQSHLTSVMRAQLGVTPRMVARRP